MYLKFMNRVDLMLIILTTKIKDMKKSFGGDGYVHYLDCGENTMGICRYKNSSKCIHKICTSFV